MSYYIEPNTAEIVERMPFDEYKALDRVNQSLLKTLLSKSERHAKRQLDEPDGPASEAMTFGTMAHEAVLEGKVAPHPSSTHLPYDGYRRGKAWEEHVFRAKQLNLLPTTATDFDKLLARQQDAVSMLENIPPQGRELFSHHNEATILFDFISVDDGSRIPAKARLDGLTPKVVADYKTIASGVSRSAVRTAIGRYFYDLQAAFYTMAAEALDGTRRQFAWVFQESAPPTTPGSTP